MKVLLAALAVAVLAMARPLWAQQDVVWVQIEAQPSLREAQEAARGYAARLPDVNGFALSGGWYAIVLGPYTREDADRVLRVYRAEGQVPGDSYLQFTARLGQQFWPIGADVLARGTVTAPVPATPTPAPETAQAGEAPTQTPALTALPDETPAEARRGEAELSAEDRRALQVALQWAGFYSAAIDGAFGPGTRSAMSAWQSANGHEATGILTTAQRAQLLDQFNAPLTSVGMAMVTEDEAGIELMLPMGEIAFEKYEPPFVHFASSGDLGVRVLLISQPGDQGTLFGLFDIMQTLKIVPLTGLRERRSDSFTLVGENAEIVSHTEASLRDGHVKGFTLVWPRGDEARRARVLAAMRDSFTRLDTVLDPAAGDATQNIDLVAGLQVRRPKLSRSGFFVDDAGTIVTTSEVTASCARITVDGDVDADIVGTDAGLGVSVLRPRVALAPMAVARFSDAVPRLQSEVAVAGFPYEGILSAPTLTFGTLSDIKGLRGETEVKRLALEALPGDAGGPVLDAGGGVVGMLLPRADGATQLPRDVSFAANAQAIGSVLTAAGLSPATGAGNGPVTPAELNRVAAGMTTLVSCWE
ncbi:MAG: peptidoglycan-binding protein [Rhodobacteraceae bacterium]|nr:MAG: peptidoglycan-binding protein [Paracoccaceae bacterium]